MKRTRQSSRRRDQGYALLITIVFIGIALLLLGSVMNWTYSSARQTARNKLYSSAVGAAEAADETVVGFLMRDFYQQTYNSVASYETNLPAQDGWPIQYSFSDESGNADHTSLILGDGTYGNNFPPPVYQALGWQYQGLNGYVITGIVSSTAAPLNQAYNVPTTVKEQFLLTSIPLCQFAIFYNMDMEICPGGSMTVNGPTYVNGTIYADPSQTLTFGGTVQTTASQVMYTNSPGDPQSHVQNPSVVYSVTNSPATNQPTLTLPVGTNSFEMTGTNNVITNSAASVSAILDLPPAGVDPGSQLGQEYLYNQANMVVSNSSDGTISAYFQNSNNVNRLTPIPYDAQTVTANTVTNGYTTNYQTNITSTPIYSGSGRHKKLVGYSYQTNVTAQTAPVTGTAYSTNFYYSFATNTTFYDYREGKTVQAVQLNVGALNSWLTSTNGGGYNSQLYTDTGHYIDSVYVYNNAPSDNSDLPSVRVANGSVLPTQGLTVATPDPLYVLGNYNATGSALNTSDTSSSAPAALMGDAITVLSTTWNDSYNSRTSLNSRNAGSTTVNAATMEGIVPSVTVNGVKHYSGGVENFLRLLENWSGDTLTYNGSIVVMFDSRYATNYWQNPGAYYDVPTRNWGFDVNFAQGQDKLPPMFPQVKVMIRQQWSAN